MCTVCGMLDPSTNKCSQARGLVKLGVEAVSLDFPSGPSKAFANKWMILVSFSSALSVLDSATLMFYLGTALLSGRRSLPGDWQLLEISWDILFCLGSCKPMGSRPNPENLNLVVCEDCQLPSLRLHCVLAWSLNRFSQLLDNSDMWLDDDTARALVEKLEYVYLLCLCV